MRARSLSWLLIVSICCACHPSIAVGGEDDASIVSLIGRYRQASTRLQHDGILRQIRTFKTSTASDLTQLRGILSAVSWDADLFRAASASVANVDDPALGPGLAGILADGKALIVRAERGDLGGRTVQEMDERLLNALMILRKLGELKHVASVPLLKECLASPRLRLEASLALGALGDRSASDEVRERAYRGEKVAYGGLGPREAERVVRDLENGAQRDRWTNIAAQLLWVKDPGVKPGLIRLFRHEDSFVRMRASTAFVRLCGQEDLVTVLAMSREPDWGVRAWSVDAMKKLGGRDCEARIRTLAQTDPNGTVRAHAAQAAGGKP